MAIYAKFDGLTWTDISSDVRTVNECFTGNRGGDEGDRVGSVGYLNLVMDNSENNSAGLVGYYSVGHENCRSGFGAGLEIKVEFSFNGQVRAKWTGKVTPGISPKSGVARSRDTKLTAHDYFGQLAETDLSEIDIAYGKRAEEAIEIILTSVGSTGITTDFDQGIDTLTSVFSTVRGETPAIQEIDKLVNSERGFLYLNDENTLVFENREHRNSSTSLMKVPLPTSECKKLITPTGKRLVTPAGKYVTVPTLEDVIFDNTMSEMDPQSG